MKFLYLILILFLLSCGTAKKTYICGDRPCIDKKEFNEYFAENLIVEVINKNKNKTNKFDLVKLNTNSSVPKNDDIKSIKQLERMEKKLNKDKLKAKKKKILEERKKSKKLKKRELKRQNKIAKRVKIREKKIRNTNVETVINNEQSNNSNSAVFDKKVNNNAKKKEVQIDTVDFGNVESVCDKIVDCDIDKIAELLIKQGQDKPFPDITSN